MNRYTGRTPSLRALDFSTSDKVRLADIQNGLSAVMVSTFAIRRRKVVGLHIKAKSLCHSDYCSPIVRRVACFLRQFAAQVLRQQTGRAFTIPRFAFLERHSAILAAGRFVSSAQNG